MTRIESTPKSGHGTPRGTPHSHQSHGTTPRLTRDFPTVPTSPTSHSHPIPTSPTTLRSGTVGHLGPGTHTRHLANSPDSTTTTHTKSTTHKHPQRPRSNP